MTPIVVSVVAVLVAVVVIAVLARRFIPESGLLAWLRDSFGSVSVRDEISAMRAESARLAEPEPETGDLTVADIMGMAEPEASVSRRSR